MTPAAVGATGLACAVGRAALTEIASLRCVRAHQRAALTPAAIGSAADRRIRNTRALARAHVVRIARARQRTRAAVAAASVRCALHRRRALRHAHAIPDLARVTCIARSARAETTVRSARLATAARDAPTSSKDAVIRRAARRARRVRAYSACGAARRARQRAALQAAAATREASARGRTDYVRRWACCKRPAERHCHRCIAVRHCARAAVRHELSAGNCVQACADKRQRAAACCAVRCEVRTAQE